jgi:hypothetical protein
LARSAKNNPTITDHHGNSQRTKKLASFREFFGCGVYTR